MKYCPYCGADLVDGAASFCMECGKKLSGAKSGQRKPAEERFKPRKRKKKEQEFRFPKSRKMHDKISEIRMDEPLLPKDDGYDGYYDDVLPADAGKLKEGVDMKLVKKISAVAGVMLLIIILCVVAMYLL